MNNGWKKLQKKNCERVSKPLDSGTCLICNCQSCLKVNIPAGIYLLKINNGNARMCENCSKLTMKTPEQHP